MGEMCRTHESFCCDSSGGNWNPSLKGAIVLKHVQLNTVLKGAIVLKHVQLNPYPANVEKMVSS